MFLNERMRFCKLHITCFTITRHVLELHIGCFKITYWVFLNYTLGVLKLSFQTCAFLNKHMCFSRLHIVYISPYTLRVLHETHMF